MLSTESGTPVHFPANPDRFEFDSEVAKVFPDMASRSIPCFHTAHAAHARICEYITQNSEASVLDIGASRGAFFSWLSRTKCRAKLVAIDSSASMCEYLQKDFQGAEVHHLDITSLDFDRFAEANQFDVVCCNYVIQFLPPQEQMRVLLLICRMVKVGGLMFFGHKEDHASQGALGSLSHEEYIRFRLGQGYTREEVEAKTKALRGSMFPMKHDRVMDLLRDEFREVVETTRYMMFSTIAARK